MEPLKSLANVELTHVPFKGSSQSVPAVMSGDVAVAFAGLNFAQPQAAAGKVKILAVATERRATLAPDIPTLAESGVAGFDINISLGYVAPPKTPQEVIVKLNAELMKAVNAPEVRQRLFALGVEASPATSPEHFGEVIRHEHQQYGKLVKATGARAD